MIRTVLFLFTALALCGCMITNYDYAAAQAVKTHDALHRKNPPARLTVAEVLSLRNSQDHNRCLRELARLHCAGELVKLYRKPLNPDGLRAALLDAEKARIRLNHLLGFLPETPIDYDTAGAFEVPDELPDVTAFEKAVLVASAEKKSALDRLCQIRLAHAEAVAAYDAAAHAATPVENCLRQYQRLVRCTELADAAGTTLANLPEVSIAAGRFDSYRKHPEITR